MMQTLDIVFYSLQSHPGKRLSYYEVAEVFGRAHNRVVNVDKGRSGCQHCGIFPHNPNRFSDSDFQTLIIVLHVSSRC